MAQSFSDDFNRPDSTTLGNGWVAPNASISGNAAHIDLLGNTSTVIYQDATPLDAVDHYAEIKWVSGADSVLQGGPSVRINSTGDTYYHARINQFGDDTSYDIFSVVSGGFTQLATVSPGGLASPPLTLRLAIEGSQIDFSLDGVVVLSTIDTAITTGVRVGGRFRHAGSSAISVFDDFSSAVIGAAVTGTGDSVSGPSTSSGSGTGVTIGSGASVSQSSSSSGTGTGVTTGSGASVSGPSTSAGNGLRVITGSGDSISGPSTSSGTGGTGSAVVTGSGDSQSGPATSSGTGTGVTVGSGASASGPATSTGVALRVITGSGSSQSGPATSSGTGGSVRVVTGSGNSVSGPSTSTGVGLRVITGSGSSVSGPAASEGSDRGALARPVIKPGSIDIAPKYASIDIAPKYGTTDY